MRKKEGFAVGKRISRMVKTVTAMSMCLILSMTGTAASAAESETPDLSRKGSLSITFTYDGEPISDGNEVGIIKVADVVDDNGYKFVYRDAFAKEGEVPKDLDAVNSSLASKLDRIAREQKVTMYRKSQKLDENGKVTFSDLDLGLYLIIHTFDLLGGSGGSNSTEKDSGVTIDLTAGTVKVPDLLGKTENEAQQILRDSGLGYKYLGETSSDEYSAGQIAGQDTAAGSIVKKNTRIGYTLSIGSAQALTVPDLTNKSQSDAEKALTSIGLLVSVDNTRYSDDVISGNVMTTNPGAGSSVHEGDTVTIYVSQGQNSQSVQVPDTRGKYKDDAVTILSNSGLYVYVASEPSDTVDANLVIRQDIAPGSSVQTGSAITITVSTGPQDVVVINPDGSQNGGGQGADTSGAWMCYAQLQAPSGFTDGSPVRITLAQNESEVTVFEGTTSFPYLMNVRGQDGVASGTAYVYMLDASGNVLSTTKYDGIAFYPQG